MSSPSPIPHFYRIFFTRVDPLISLFGILSAIFTPHIVLNSFSPTYSRAIAHETTILLDHLAAFLVGMVFIQVYLLPKRANDLLVWRAFEAGTLLIDLGLLAAVGRSLSAQGRLELGRLRAEDWGNLGITGTVAVVRGAFLLGLGFEGKGKRA